MTVCSHLPDCFENRPSHCGNKLTNFPVEGRRRSFRKIVHIMHIAKNTANKYNVEAKSITNAMNSGSWAVRSEERRVGTGRGTGRHTRESETTWGEDVY